MSLLPVQKRNLSDDITSQLRRRILSGELLPGDRLESERDLAERLGTNRNTLREAIRNLETMGLVTVRQGDGVRVVDWRTGGGVMLLAHFLDSAADPEEVMAVLGDLLRVRAVFVVEVAGRAAETASPEALAELRRLYDLQKAQWGDVRKVLGTDFELVAALVAATGSLVYRWLFNAFSPSYTAFLDRNPGLWVVQPDYLASLEKVLAAIEAGDAAAARRAMADHMALADRSVDGFAWRAPDREVS